MRAVLPRLGLLTLLLGLAALVSVSTGAARIPIPEIIPALAGRAEGTSRSILLHLRLPRVVLAMGVGGALALAGTTFQALLRNPLAEPYVLGISGGAAVGAVAVLVGGLGARVPGAVPLGAFVGALVAMFLVLRVAMAAGGRRLDPRVLILSGVVVGAFFNAVILLLLSLADVESFRSAIFWMMGNLSGATWGGNAMLALYIVPGSLLLLSLARAGPEPGGPMTLLLIRHGATHLNEARRFQGWSDPPLSPQGCRSVEAMASTLPPLLPDVPVHVSDLRRARETARILFPHVALRVDTRLRELHFGRFEEWTAEEAAAREPEAWARWMADPAEAPPPDGESLRHFQARVREWFEEELTSGEAAVVVAHGGTLGFLLELLNVDRAVPAPGEAVELSPNETNP